MVQKDSLMKEKLLIISGPTGVGKTDISLKIAKKFNGEIISCDSMQIYKGFDIGTAKIKEEEKNGIVHHMIDVVEPDSSYSVYEYKSKVQELITNLNKKNKMPIMVGGTGLYIDSVLYDYDFKKADKNQKLRDYMQHLTQKYGNQFLCLELDKVNIDYSKIAFNDTRRLIRLLEADKKDGNETKKSKYDFLHISLKMDRLTLYERINKRVDLMFNNGLQEEVENLLKQGIGFDSQPMQSIGYKEFKEYFDGVISFDELKEKIKQNSRHYAKRQLTWFNNSDNIVNYDLSLGADNIYKILGEWYNK